MRLGTYGLQAAIRTLCSAQADLEIRDAEFGMTAFLIACEHGCADAVRTLAECGADINAKDNDGSGAQRLAEVDRHEVRKQRSWMLTVCRSSKCFRVFLFACCDAGFPASAAGTTGVAPRPSTKEEARYANCSIETSVHTTIGQTQSCCT